MAHSYAQLAFTPAVRQVQQERGSRSAYARLDEGEVSEALLLTNKEKKFIAARDSFYWATLSETGWPYMQHRGGPAGFLQVLNECTLAFLDYRGNRQYVSVGNLRGSNKVSLFFMDYANRNRLKVMGFARVVSLEEAADLGVRRARDGYRAHPEHAIVIDVAAFDWNCPQHITQRFTLTELEPSIEALRSRVTELETMLAAAGGDSIRYKKS